MIDLNGGIDSEETTRYNDSLTLVARGKIHGEKIARYLSSQTNLQQSRQGNLQLTISSPAGEADMVEYTIDCKEVALPVQVEILITHYFN